jgi:tetratricopeptide (TPR) repeat protein
MFRFSTLLLILSSLPVLFRAPAYAALSWSPNVISLQSQAFLQVVVLPGSEEQIRQGFAESYRLESLQDYSGAVKSLETLGQEVMESVYEANLRLGWLCYKAGNNDKSLAYYQQAIALQPLATEPLWGLLLPVTAREDWVRAESLYKAILKQDHRNATAHYRLGLIYYYRQNYPEALKFLEVSLRLSPFDYYSMLMTGWTRYFLGQKTEAKVLFERVLRFTPQDASALEGLNLLAP